MAGVCDCDGLAVRGSGYGRDVATKGHLARAERLQGATGALATAAMAAMDEQLPWFGKLSAQDRSWIGLVAQSGITAFVDWFRDPEEHSSMPIRMFGSAPREFTRVISLHQTVDLLRTTIEMIENTIGDLLPPEDVPAVREAMQRYAREVAFAAATVYAQAAEMRGAWDARLEALVVDSVIRGEADESVRSRASALGWTGAGTTGSGEVHRGRRTGTPNPNPAAPTWPTWSGTRPGRPELTLCARCRATGWWWYSVVRANLSRSYKTSRSGSGPVRSSSDRS